MTDLIDIEAGVREGSELDDARRARPHAREHSQAAFDALFHGNDDEFPLIDRLTIAAFVVGIGSVPLDHYAVQLATLDGERALHVEQVARGARAAGPFGRFSEPALAADDTDGSRFTPSSHDVARFGPRVAAALAHAHLLVTRPREASEQHLETLVTAGWSVDAVVTLSQLVSFLSYQTRVVHGLRVLGGATASVADGFAHIAPVVDAAPRPPSGPEIPTGFTQDQLWWEPWLAPLDREELTEAHYEGLVERPRAALPYFRLLARDPAVLRARTLADLDIFTNEDGGLDRAERELAAAATSRLNGCVFCASVHARTASRLSGRRDDVQRLLDEGVDARIDPRWDAVIAASVALTRTPVAFGGADVDRLREQGASTQAIFDLISAAAFFNWANRLMLSIGEVRVNAAKLDVIRAYEGTKTP